MQVGHGDIDEHGTATTSRAERRDVHPTTSWWRSDTPVALGAFSADNLFTHGHAPGATRRRRDFLRGIRAAHPAARPGGENSAAGGGAGELAAPARAAPHGGRPQTRWRRRGPHWRCVPRGRGENGGGNARKRRSRSRAKGKRRRRMSYSSSLRRDLPDAALYFLEHILALEIFSRRLFERRRSK